MCSIHSIFKQIVVIVLFLNGGFSIAGSYSYIYSYGQDYESAKQCENYIFNNALNFYEDIVRLSKDYGSKKEQSIISYMESGDFERFEDAAMNCSLYMNYHGERQYFHELHADVLAVRGLYDLAINFNLYKDICHMEHAVQSLENTISQILSSTRTDN